MSRPHPWRYVLALVAAIMLTAAPLRAETTAIDPAAQAPVTRLTDTLLATMKEADTLGFEGRYAKLDPVLHEVFDFRFMARLSLGTHWRKLTDDQQGALVDAFARLSVSTFAARFDGYSGQGFEVRDPRKGPNGTVLVPTHLTRPDKDAVTISYLMRESDSDWNVIDIYMKGSYSEVASRRSEYTGIMKREGFDSLLKRIRGKAEEVAGTHDHPWE